MKFETKEDALKFKSKIKSRILAEQEEGRKIEENIARLQDGLSKINTYILALDRLEKPYVVEIFETSKISDGNNKVKVFKEKENAIAYANDVKIEMIKNDFNGHISVYKIIFDEFTPVNYEFLQFNLVTQNQKNLYYVYNMLSSIEVLEEENKVIRQDVLYKPFFYLSENKISEYSNREIIDKNILNIYARFKEIKSKSDLCKEFKSPNKNNNSFEINKKIIEILNTPEFYIEIGKVDTSSGELIMDIDALNDMSSITINIINS